MSDFQIEMACVEQYLREESEKSAVLFAWMAEKFEEAFAWKSGS